MLDLKQHDPATITPPPADHITLLADENGVPTIMQPDGSFLPLSTNGVLPTVASPFALPGSVIDAKLFFSANTNDLYLLVGSQKFIIALIPA